MACINKYIFGMDASQNPFRYHIIFQQKFWRFHLDDSYFFFFFRKIKKKIIFLSKHFIEKLTNKTYLKSCRGMCLATFFVLCLIFCEFLTEKIMWSFLHFLTLVLTNINHSIQILELALFGENYQWHKGFWCRPVIHKAILCGPWRHHTIEKCELAEWTKQ